MAAILADNPRHGGIPRTVLVVEDDVLVRMMIAEELRDAGFSVIEAANADEALTVLDSAIRVELVMTDVFMPGSVDGVGFAAAIRSTFPSTTDRAAARALITHCRAADLACSGEHFEGTGPVARSFPSFVGSWPAT